MTKNPAVKGLLAGWMRPAHAVGLTLRERL